MKNKHLQRNTPAYTYMATPSPNGRIFASKFQKKPRKIVFFSKNGGKNVTPKFLPNFFLSNVLSFFPSSSFSSSVYYFCLLPLLIFVFFLPPLLSLCIIILFLLLLLSPSDSRSLLPGSLDFVAHFQLPFPAQSSIVFRVICIDLRRYWVS